jgi:hypothetical protein
VEGRKEEKLESTCRWQWPIRRACRVDMIRELPTRVSPEEGHYCKEAVQYGDRAGNKSHAGELSPGKMEGAAALAADSR